MQISISKPVQKSVMLDYSFFKISLQDQMFTFLYPIIIWQEVLKLTQFSHTVLCFKEHLILYVFNCMLTLQGFGLTTEDNI